MAKQKGNETPFVVPMVGVVLIALILFKGDALINMVENMTTLEKADYLTDKIYKARMKQLEGQKSKIKTTTKAKCCSDIFESHRGEDGSDYARAYNLATNRCKYSCDFLNKCISKCVKKGEKCDDPNGRKQLVREATTPRSQRSVANMPGATPESENSEKLETYVKREVLSEKCQAERNECMLVCR